MTEQKSIDKFLRKVFPVSIDVEQSAKESVRKVMEETKEKSIAQRLIEAAEELGDRRYDAGYSYKNSDEEEMYRLADIAREAFKSLALEVEDKLRATHETGIGYMNSWKELKQREALWRELDERCQFQSINGHPINYHRIQEIRQQLGNQINPEDANRRNTSAGRAGC